MGAIVCFCFNRIRGDLILLVSVRWGTGQRKVAPALDGWADILNKDPKTNIPKSPSAERLPHSSLVQWGIVSAGLAVFVLSQSGLNVGKGLYMTVFVFGYS